MHNYRFIYLGDGVYIEFAPHGIWIRTATHDTITCEDEIYLDKEVLKKLLLALKGLKNV